MRSFAGRRGRLEPSAAPAQPMNACMMPHIGHPPAAEERDSGKGTPTRREKRDSGDRTMGWD
jgi:hypothetical protein